MPGAARVGDKSHCPADSHGCPGCPHGVAGPAVSGSPNVYINGRPAVRVGDSGIHAACCGPNTWVAVEGSPNVFVNDRPIHRLGDADQHCGGMGRMIEASGDVLINEGGEPEEAGRRIVATGLGDQVDQLVNQSPTLTAQVHRLHQEGWSIQWGRQGEGSYADRDERRIVLDPAERNDPALVTQTLAHEAGHATYERPPEVPMEGLTRDEYVERNVRQDLEDEGQATLNNLRVRDEILAAGGPDIGVAGANERQYREIWRDLQQGNLTTEEARGRIAEAFRSERTSTTGEDYVTYYGRYYEERWDEEHQ